MPPPPQTWDPPTSMLRLRLPLQLRTSASHHYCIHQHQIYAENGNNVFSSISGWKPTRSMILPYRSFK